LESHRATRQQGEVSNPHHRRLNASAKPPKVACARLAVFLSSGAWRQRGQALKNSPGIRASLRGATVLDQWQAGQE
jgi:hypothetical protein